jgi:hypothetical protein
MSFINYNNYLLEKENENKSYLQYIYNLPLEKRQELLLFLDNKDVNESFIGNITDKVKYWINKKVFDWLINQTEREILSRIKELKALDPTTIDDLQRIPKIIYLGGGIDKTPDIYQVIDPTKYNKIISLMTNFFKEVSEETNIPSLLLKVDKENNTFEVKRRTDLSFLEADGLLNYIKQVIGGSNWRIDIEKYIGLKHVLRGEAVTILTNDGKLITPNNKFPILINPLRSEGNKRKDTKWIDLYRKWKSNEILSKEDHITFQKKIQKNIVTPDLRMLNVCDTNLVRLDGSEGAGTQQELGMSTFRWMNIFIWLENGYGFADISPWLFPSVSKLLRSKEEVYTLLNTIKKEYNY